MKISMIIFNIDLINKPQFHALIDKGNGWKTLVLFLGIFVFELFLTEREK